MQADTGTTIKVYKLQENYTKELIKCLFVLEKNKDSKDVNKQHNFHNCTLMNYKNIFKELYKRLIIPFYIPLLIIISLIIITKSKENVNFTKFRTLIFIIGLVMMIFSESTQKLIDDNLKINLIIVSLPFVITSFVYILIFYNLRYKVNRA
jgi:lipopolysaccharide export system permease protein